MNLFRFPPKSLLLHELASNQSYPSLPSLLSSHQGGPESRRSRICRLVSQMLRDAESAGADAAVALCTAQTCVTGSVGRAIRSSSSGCCSAWQHCWPLRRW